MPCHRAPDPAWRSGISGPSRLALRVLLLALLATAASYLAVCRGARADADDPSNPGADGDAALAERTAPELPTPTGAAFDPGVEPGLADVAEHAVDDSDADTSGDEMLVGADPATAAAQRWTGGPQLLLAARLARDDDWVRRDGRIADGDHVVRCRWTVLLLLSWGLR